MPPQRTDSSDSAPQINAQDTFLCNYCGNKIAESFRYCNKCGRENKNTSIVDQSQLTVDQPQPIADPAQATVDQPAAAIVAPQAAIDETPATVGEQPPNVGAASPIGDQPKKNPKIFLVVLIILLVIVIPYFILNRSSWSPGPVVILRLYGSDIIGESLLPELAKEYLRQEGATLSEPPVTKISDEVSEVHGYLPRDSSLKIITIQSRKSNDAFNALSEGKCDLGFPWRKINPNEITRIRAANIGDMALAKNELLFAYDSIVIIVHQRNQISALSRNELKDILLGKIRTWSQLSKTEGTVSDKINVYLPDEDSEIYGVIQSLFEPNEEIYAAEKLKKNYEVADKVNQDENGIGIVDLPNVRRARIVPVNDEERTVAHNPAIDLECSKSLFCHPLFIYKPEQVSSHTVKFMKFLPSEAARNIIKSSGFFPIAASSMSAEKYGSPECGQLMKGAEKMLDFKCLFRSRESVLDDEARQAIRAAAITVKMSKRELILLGFTDNEGTGYFNQELSERRAKAVKEEFIRLNINPKAIKGCGVIATGNTPDEKRMNRRVEVWLNR